MLAIVVSEHGPVENAKASCVMLGLLSDVFFDISPKEQAAPICLCRLVEYLVLGSAVREMECIVVGSLRFGV